MIETKNIASKEARDTFACYECQAVTSLPELEFVDDLIEHSPFFKGVSENFSFCSGDDGFFHGNIVNCCIGCYAQIIQGMALWDDDSRKREIGNLIRALRTKPAVPVKVIINTEHVLAGLIGMDGVSSLAIEDLQEALYSDTSPLHAELDALAG